MNITYFPQLSLKLSAKTCCVCVCERRWPLAHVYRFVNTKRRVAAAIDDVAAAAEVERAAAAAARVNTHTLSASIPAAAAGTVSIIHHTHAARFFALNLRLNRGKYVMFIGVERW